jgi:hypothetical protein
VGEENVKKDIWASCRARNMKNENWSELR